MAIQVGTQKFTTQSIIDRALARCKIPRQLITGEMQLVARDTFQLFLNDCPNKFTPLWCIDRIQVPVYENEPEVLLPKGTIDVLPDSVFYRTIPRVGDSYISVEGVAANAGDGDLTTVCTQTSINGTLNVQFFSTTTVAIVGVIFDGNNFYNLAFDASNDGVNWTELYTVEPPYDEIATHYLNARWAWYEVPSPATALFFRIRETSGGILKVRELYLGQFPTDLEMSRLNREQYLTLPNKRFRGGGRPLQFWFNRFMDSNDSMTERAQLVLWPVPGPQDRFSNVFLARKRYIADIQEFNGHVELPQRAIDAITWGLASYLAAELSEVDSEREALLEGRAKQEMGEMMDEERDNSPITIQADISSYTR